MFFVHFIMITFLSLLLLRFNFSCFCIFPSAFFIATMALAVVDRVRMYQCHYCCNNVTVDGTACQFSGDYKGVARPCEMEEVLWWKGNMCIGSGNNCCSTCFAGCGKKSKNGSITEPPMNFGNASLRFAQGAPRLRVVSVVKQ